MLVNNYLKGIAYATLSGISYGWLAYFSLKILNSGLSVSETLFLRFITAALILSPFIFKNKLYEKIKNKIFILLTLSGGILYAFGAHCYLVAAEKIGSGLAMVAFFTFPVFIYLFEWLIDHKLPTKFTSISITFILIGLFFLADVVNCQYQFSYLLLAVFAGFQYAIYIYVNRKYLTNTFLSTFLVCLCSALILLPFSEKIINLSIVNFSNIYVDVLMVGFICTLLPILFLLKSLKYIDASQASILSVFEPIVTLIIGTIAFNEVLSVKQYGGIVIILFGVLFMQLSERLNSK